MGSGIVSYVKSLLRFRNDYDLRVSDELVKGLGIPDESKRFVFAIKEPETEAVVYVVCVMNLSERSAVDVERVVRCVRPGAVVAQLNQVGFDDVQGEEGCLVPTSTLGVVKRCFLHKIGKDTYENVAGSVVLKEIFGVGFNGQFWAAKRIAEEVGSSFMSLESSYVNLESENHESSPSGEVASGNGFQGLRLLPNNLIPQKASSVMSSGSARYFISDDYVHSQIVKSLCSHLVQLSGDQITGTSPMDILPRDDYEAPQYARSIYPLLQDLHRIFAEIPSVGRALAYAQQMFHDVSNGNNIDTQLLSEVYAFRIAVEGLRIALNNAGRMPISKTGKAHQNADFSNLPSEEKSHALLAHAIRSQTKNFKSIVAVLDASTLAGLRKHWNTTVPSDLKDMVEELIADSTKDEEPSNHSDKKRGIKNKPVVAVGAGATAVVGASSLSKAVPASTLLKVVTFKVPWSLNLIMTQTQKLISISISKFLGPSKILVPGLFKTGVNTSSSMKAAASAEKIRAVVHSIIASAEKTSLSATRSAFYEIMRSRQVRPIGVLPWATFGCSVVTCTGLLIYGDGIECAVESVPSARSIASLGRGIVRLQQASHAVEQTEISRVQKSIELLFERFKRWKFAP